MPRESQTIESYNLKKVKQKQFKGVVLYDGPSKLDRSKNVIVIATFSSLNRKTGDMIQTWILVKDHTPVAASKIGADKIICGNCPHRVFNNGACYVNLGQAPQQVYRSWKRGIYPAFKKSEHGHLFEGRQLRLGAYGDPASVPFRVWKTPLSLAVGHTGYTHQIKHKNFDKRYLSICQVSADTPKQAIAYQELGAKTFRVALPKDKMLKGEKVCLSETQGKQCARCMLCNGSKQNIVIAVHGSRMKRFKSNLIPTRAA